MKKRIQTLRENSINAVSRICPERARLITEFYKNVETSELSPPVRRAMAFKYLMENKTICINPLELIVGERGTAPKAVPTYPEICIHSLEDLEILNNREKISFSSDDNTRGLYRDSIIPFWKGKSMRDRVFQVLPEEWKNAYAAGIFTEFMEQRSPGHAVMGNKIYSRGFLDLKQEIKEQIRSLDYFNDPDAVSRKEELQAMSIAADAIIIFAERHARKLRELAAIEKDSARKHELKKMAEICSRVPAHAPRTFHEALQCYWFVHQGVISETNPWDSFNPGRLDQHLYPFYKKDIESGELTEEYAREILESFWIKFNNHPAPPKVGVTGKESNTYTDFCLINLGGVKEDGSDAVNELSYIILDVLDKMRLLQPSSMVQVSKKNPDRFVDRALKVIRTGFGQPSVFNTDSIIQELTHQGKSVMDARRSGCGGCVETSAFGAEACILTGYFNLPKILEITLHNGVDPRTGRKIGIETGPVKNLKTFKDLMAAYEEQLNHFVDIKIKGNNIIAQMYAKYLPVPFLSLLIDDCIKKGKDYNDGGARYNTRYIMEVGIGSITDSLAALKYHVYERKNITLPQIVKILDSNFKGHEKLRNELVNRTPKYGNDDDYADDLMREVFEMFYNAVEGRPAGSNGKHHVMLLNTTCHVYFGGLTGALPDGRKAGKPFSEGMSPVQGADRKGPTSVVKSAAKMDHVRTGGTLLNLKFTPRILKNDAGIDNLRHLIRSYFKLDGHHVQFNVVDAETLRKAQKDPEEYRSLIIRVAGYSDYFVDLTRDLQDEIIQRTAHEAF